MIGGRYCHLFGGNIVACIGFVLAMVRLLLTNGVAKPGPLLCLHSVAMALFRQKLRFGASQRVERNNGCIRFGPEACIVTPPFNLIGKGRRVLS